MALITPKSLDEWKTLQLDKWKELEPNINTNTDSMVSMDAMVISEVAYLLEQDLITQTNNAFLAYASWDELSNLWADRWIARKVASSATWVATYSRTTKDTVNYTIPLWNLISTIEDSSWAIITFQTTAEWTLYWIIGVPTWLTNTLSTGWTINNGTRVYTVTAVDWNWVQTSVSWSTTSVISNGLTTNSIVLDWTPVERAISYNIYLWWFFLANSLTDSYTDIVWTTASIITTPLTNLTWATSVNVPIISTLEWVITNVWINSITKFIETPTWIETVINLTATSGWADEETDTIFRERIRYDLANNFWKITASWYTKTALAVSWVASATTLHEVWNPANEISVFILATWTNPIPSAWLILEVQTLMDLDENRAVCDSIVVKAPTVVNIAVTMTITSYDTSYTELALTNLIKDELQAYFVWLWVWWVVRVVDISNVIHDMDAVTDFTLSLPTTNTTLTSTQIASNWVITVNF